MLLCTWPYHRDPLPTEDAVLTHVTSKLGTVQRALPVLPKHLLEVRVLKKGSGVAAIRGVRPSGPCENSPPCAMVGRAMRYRSYCPRIDLTFLIAFRGRSSLGVGMGCIDSRRISLSLSGACSAGCVLREMGSAANQSTCLRRVRFLAVTSSSRGRRRDYIRSHTELAQTACGFCVRVVGRHSAPATEAL